MLKVRGVKALNILLFILELGTMLYFIPLLIYLAEFSFGLPGIGFFVGILGIVHYYIFRWYYDGGSLVYLGVSLLVGVLASAVVWLSDTLDKIFFPAGYLFEYSRFFLPGLAKLGPVPLFYYYVFLTGIVYASVGRFLLERVCVLCGLKLCRHVKSSANNKVSEI